MKKILLLVSAALIAVDCYPQSVTLQYPLRTGGIGSPQKVIQDKYGRFVKSLWIPVTNSTTPTLNNTPDSAGNGIQLLSNKMLAVSLGGGLFAKYPDLTEIQSMVGISGTSGYVPVFTSSSTIGNSSIYDSGTAVSIGGSSPTAMLDVNAVGIGAGARIGAGYIGNYISGATAMFVSNNTMKSSTTGFALLQSALGSTAVNSEVGRAVSISVGNVVIASINSTSMSVTGKILASLPPTNPTDVVRKTELDLKAPLSSPALTGTPTVPTASTGTNTTQAASTAFVQQEILAGRIVNNTTTALTTSDLNTTYPGVKVGYIVICPDIVGAPVIYTKATEDGTSDVWLTTAASITP